MSRARSAVAPTGVRRRTVSSPHDPAERQADRAADVVARGGSVSGWSLGSVPLSGAVHREEKGSGPSDEDKLKKAAEKVGEAALETEAGKKLQEKVKSTPVVKAATSFLDTTPGKLVAGGVIAAGVGGLAAAKQPLPFQAPAIPLDIITPGLSAKVTVEGPLNAPTFAGLSLTYKEQGPKKKGGPSDSDRYAAETARIRAANEQFMPLAQRDQAKADEQATIAALLAAQGPRLGVSTLIPIGPSTTPKTVPVPKATPDAAEEKKPDDAPLQREALADAPAHDSLDLSGVDGALRGGGRPLEPAVRRSMETRFGHDFSSVRIHDHAAAVGAAGDLKARAFTLGEDIVMGSGEFAPQTPAGRHLLAHELAHVVQQRRGGGEERLHRRGAGETLGILLGIVEGTWSDRELRAYLDQVTAAHHIDGSYDADNKARAIVRLWKAGTSGWELDGAQKSLLIDEMLDGPTTGDDETSILELLEGSDAGDLRTIFADAPKRMRALDSDIDGDNHDRLDAFVAARFSGGRPELFAGRVVVLGASVPAAAPVFGFDAAVVAAWLDSDRSWQEVDALISHLTTKERSAALGHLLRLLWPQSKSELGRARNEIFKDGVTEEQQKAIYDGTKVVRDRVAKIERILMHEYAQSVPSTEGDLRAATGPLDPALLADMRQALKPHQYAAEAAADESLIELDDEPTEKSAAPAPTKTPAKATGKPVGKPASAAFHDPKKYRADVEKELPGIIDEKYASHVTDAGSRAKMDEIQAMAHIAKIETDAVFGRFYDPAKHPEMKGDAKGKPGNLHFWYDEATRDLKGLDSEQRRQLAVSWIMYYFQSDSTIRLLNDKYNAAPAFDAKNNPKNDEARILASIADHITKASPAKKPVKGKPTEPSVVDKLLETWRNWGGMARGREVFVDLFHSPEAEKDRAARWDMFQTLIHEYIHTLVNHDYETYATGFGSQSPEWNTLIEGVDSVLDEVVWAHVLPRTADAGIRSVVEGEAQAKQPHKEPPYPGRYPSHDEAMRMVGIVGIDAVYAAYFLGLVDRIGGLPKPRPKGAA